MGKTRLLACVIGLSWGVAHADGLDGERFVPSIGAEGTFVDEHPSVPSPWGWSLGLFLNYADDQIVLKDPMGRVGQQVLHTGFTADLTGSIGILGWAELGIGLPIHIIYDGTAFSSGGAVLAPNRGVGDLRLVPKFALVRNGTLRRHWLLGLGVPVSFPTGDDQAARGQGGFTLWPELLFAFHDRKLGLGADAGFRWRSHHSAALPWADEVTFGPWVSYGLTDDVTLRAEMFGAKQVNTRVTGADFPIEVLLGVDWAIGDVDLYLGASRGLTDGIGDPVFRIIGGIRYRHDSPRHEGFEDSDRDGIRDKDDKCRNEPEDEDGFEDSDGCPDPDNDEDGIPDKDDECPEQAGDRAHDGCPAKTYVRIENGRVYIFGKVQFATGSARIDRRSDQLLDQVAYAIKSNPGVGKIRVEGHTDNVGDPKFNQQLSEERSQSVKEALEKRGVAAGRLTARGFGETRPIAPNKAPAGRAKNRRVEFIITGGR